MMLSITPTKLSDYLSCPLKYKLKHIEKSGGISSSAAFSFGTSMHKALQEFHNRKMDAKTSSLNVPDEPGKLLRPFWEKNAYETEEEARTYFLKGCRALKNYQEASDKDSSETLGTEVYMSFIIDFKGLKIRLGCKADRISLDKDGVLEIVDYKTSRAGNVPTPEFLEKDLPTFIYYVLTRISYPQYPKIKITFLNVLSMAKVSVHYEKSLVDENKQALWNRLKEMTTGRYLPRTSEACCWCDFKDDCPATSSVVDFQSI